MHRRGLILDLSNAMSHHFDNTLRARSREVFRDPEDKSCLPGYIATRVGAGFVAKKKDQNCHL